MVRERVVRSLYHKSAPDAGSPSRLDTPWPVVGEIAQDFNEKLLLLIPVHIRVGLSRRFSELAVFDARLDIRIRRIDQPP